MFNLPFLSLSLDPYTPDFQLEKFYFFNVGKQGAAMHPETCPCLLFGLLGRKDNQFKKRLLTPANAIGGLGEQ